MSDVLQLTADQLLHQQLHDSTEALPDMYSLFQNQIKNSINFVTFF